MEFSKPVCTEIEGDADAKKLREYFVENGIAFKEIIEDYKYIGDLHILECSMTDEIILAANRKTGALFYHRDTGTPFYQ